MRTINLSVTSLALTLSAALIFPTTTWAQTADDFAAQLANLQQDWAVANYQLQDDAQEDEFEQLAERAKQLVTAYPDNAAAYIWQGIVLSTEAGVVGGLGALDLAEAAKASLEHAMTIDDQALEGSAYTSLGTLYYKVPGWPFGFGDDDKAEQLLKQALTINPTGIDANYFYADFLYEDGEYQKAAKYLTAAAAAAPRPGRELADSERQKEIQALQEKVNKRINKRRR
ncbi:tetratricopeptide repeat protein [Idiomarina xiamenensis]|uniref:Uncharacterized protein n=1 Tax=Idiomarina xiamenensis 10-D-4 TaxID=740709 RepID=K2JL85_9GAMM|nr:tetratricopeptide repeat protein [Idiomarina xiamenensis]EKE84206.1 hypothetical protein A10D4_05911 [Idiomarina xiamenensis 10-D-4]